MADLCSLVIAFVLGALVFAVPYWAFREKVKVCSAEIVNHLKGCIGKTPLDEDLIAKASEWAKKYVND